MPSPSAGRLWVSAGVGLACLVVILAIPIGSNNSWARSHSDVGAWLTGMGDAIAGNAQPTRSWRVLLNGYNLVHGSDGSISCTTDSQLDLDSEVELAGATVLAISLTPGSKSGAIACTREYAPRAMLVSLNGNSGIRYTWTETEEQAFLHAVEQAEPDALDEVRAILRSNGTSTALRSGLTLNGLWFASWIAFVASAWIFLATGMKAARAYRRNVQGRCRNCGYCTQGVRARICPECGEPIPNPSTNHSTPPD